MTNSCTNMMVVFCYTNMGMLCIKTTFLNFFSYNCVRAAVVIALGVGVLLSRQHWTSNLLWWLIGSAGAAVLYFAPRHWSFAGGLILGVYTMSVWPAMIDRLFCRPVARTLTLANVVYIVLTLGSVWVVAYNFVPGGEYTRERTHVLLGITMVLIGRSKVICVCNLVICYSFSSFLANR